ncbi:hypothetical protein KUDE01_009957 [Dissostichus eleginoides]|uniref:Uncharacterized protein n=1 Tax=Dissostichus eleginoides TaxID=100907 RepID=A0AAD9BYK2_DISEL|nr:hypothetical protein KUDE01_009957 [Dissostichus eleginoides]
MEDRRQQESTWRTEDSQTNIILQDRRQQESTWRTEDSQTNIILQDRRQQESTWRTEDTARVNMEDRRHSKIQHGGKKTARVNTILQDRRQQESTWRTDGTGGQSECKSTSSTLSTGAPPNPEHRFLQDGAETLWDSK